MIHICPKCGEEIEINHAAEMGKIKKTVTPAAMAARKANAQKPRPKKSG